MSLEKRSHALKSVVAAAACGIEEEDAAALGIQEYCYLCDESTWLVDRFHFLGDAPTDIVCRENCCAYALDNNRYI